MAIKKKGIVTISSFGYFKDKNIKKVVVVVEISPQSLHFFATGKKLQLSI